jgi:hypothetical protein
LNLLLICTIAANGGIVESQFCVCRCGCQDAKTIRREGTSLKEVAVALDIGVLRNQSTMRRKIHPSRYTLVRSTQLLNIDEASANFQNAVLSSQDK